MKEEGGMAGELSDVTKTQKDLLWGMYTDLRAHARHAETLRSNVVNFMIVVASVLIAVIANDGHVTRAELPLCLAIVLVGLLGLVFAASYTELHERNRQRAMMIRAVLDDKYFADDSSTIAALLYEADKRHERARLYRWTRGFTGSTQRFWFLMPSLILASGLLLTIVAL
ncbi:hypothetical protein C6361_08870 [Plantactinospora sp. BC1]|uniref:hypothetical protein n=1 Tax=Plantactinospora sp. BC1 TaxID=2108470 RepID=UPI000D16EC13|nr:hypothetical protein [Plantactinospora sp. BC1]AVT29586.1 hypothetical protein C6361_08870 [Plantactinospora sp. BC1]